MLIIGQTQNRSENLFNSAMPVSTYSGIHAQEGYDMREFQLLTIQSPVSGGNLGARLKWDGFSSYIFVTGTRRILSTNKNVTISLNGTKHVHTFGDEVGILSIDCKLPAVPADATSRGFIRTVTTGAIMSGEGHLYNLYNNFSLSSILSQNLDLRDCMVTITHFSPRTQGLVNAGQADNYLKGWVTRMSITNNDTERGLIEANIELLPFKS